MLNLVPRVFSFSGMPVPERPLETRVGEYFVTTRTVPWTSYRKVFRVCKPRRVYFIQFNFYSWAIHGILETWSCQSTKVREKKWKEKKNQRNSVSHFLSCFYSNKAKTKKRKWNRLRAYKAVSKYGPMWQKLRATCFLLTKKCTNDNLVYKRKKMLRSFVHASSPLLTMVSRKLGWKSIRKEEFFINVSSLWKALVL